MATLEEIFEGKPRDESGKFVKVEKETPPTNEIATEVKPEVAKVEPEKVVEAAPTAAEVIPAKPEESEELRGKTAALMAERKKRQEYERKVKEYEAKLQELQRQPAPDPKADPEAYATHYQNMLIDEKVNMSDEYAREKHEDYDEVMKDWVPAIQQDPTLYQRAITQKFPAEWAYQQLKRTKQMEAIGDPDAWMKAKEAELEAKYAAKYAPKVEVPKPSLASANGSGRVQTTENFGGPTPLKSIFGR